MNWPLKNCFFATKKHAEFNSNVPEKIHTTWIFQSRSTKGEVISVNFLGLTYTTKKTDIPNGQKLL